MKKIAAASSLFLLALGLGLQAQTVLKGPFEEALAKAKQENKFLLVDFFSYG